MSNRIASARPLVEWLAIFTVVFMGSATVQAQTGLQFNGTNQYVIFGQATCTLGAGVTSYSDAKVAVIDHREIESVIPRVRGFEEEIATARAFVTTVTRIRLSIAYCHAY